MRKKENIIFLIMEIIMLLTVNVIQSVFICVGIYYCAESKYTVGCVCLLLPVLSVSLFCTLAVDIKDYYFKKCNRKEFWEEGYLEIQKQDKQEKKQ